MNDEVLYGLLVAGGLSILGFLGLRLFHRTGIPDVLLLLGAGTLIGPVFHLVQVEQLSSVTPYFGTLALVFILFYGGLELDFSLVLKRALPVLFLVLVSVGTVIAGVSLLLIHVWNWHWLPATLIATLLANTSGAIVLPVISRLAIGEDDKTVLKLEAAASDVLVILIFVTLMSLMQAQISGSEAEFSARATLGTLAGSFSIAIVIGTVAGVAWILVLNKISKLQHNYFATLGLLLVLYSFTEFLGASGMMSVLFFGLVLANSRRFGQLFNVTEIQYTPNELKHLHGTFSFLIRTFFLVYIGLFLSARVFDPSFVGVGLAIMGLLVLSRLLTAGLYSLVFRRPKVTRLAVTAMLPRGLAVAALAMVPGQAVKASLEKSQPEHVRFESGLADARAQQKAIREELDQATGADAAATREALIKRELEISSVILSTSEEISKSKPKLEKLKRFESNTKQFDLFGTLSILVTNILMTLGCFWVQKESSKSNPKSTAPLESAG